MSTKEEFALEELENIRTRLSRLDESLEPLLLQIMQLFDILKFSDREKEWLINELHGYSKQDRIPDYRLVEVHLKLTIQGILRNLSNYIQNNVNEFVSDLGMQGISRKYYVTSSCADLESPSRTPLKVTEEFEVPNRYGTGSTTIEVEMQGKLFPTQKKKILRAIRMQFQSIVMKYYIRLKFETGGQQLSQRVISSLLDSLSLIDDALLEMVNDVILKQDKSGTPTEWVSCLHDLRDIMRVFTDGILREDMIPEEIEEPKHFATNTKINLVQKWITDEAKEKLRKTKGTEAKVIAQRFERLTNETADLIDLVNKEVHPDYLTEVNGEAVDRLTLQTITWMADVIDLLNQLDGLHKVEGD